VQRAACGEAARRARSSTEHPVINLPAGAGDYPTLPPAAKCRCVLCARRSPPFVPRACRSSLLSSCLAPRVLVFFSSSSCVCLPAAPFVHTHSLPCLRPCGRVGPLRCSLSCPSVPLVVVQRTGCSAFGLGYPRRGGLRPCTSLFVR
jgi:hypothetical protein